MEKLKYDLDNYIKQNEILSRKSGNLLDTETIARLRADIATLQVDNAKYIRQLNKADDEIAEMQA